MLVARVEQVARAGLDHRTQSERPQQRADALRLACPIVGKGIEVVVIQRQRDAVIPRIRNQVQRIVEPVVGGAVGVVGEAQRHRAASVSMLCSDQAT